MSVSKLPALSLNILQPKKFNTNSVLSSGNGNTINIKSEIATTLDSKEFNNSNVLQNVVLPSIVSPRGVGLATLLKMSKSSAGFETPELMPATITATKATSGGYKRGVHTMAKRNARERNRVKMVNQGFQTLRQHIPEKFRLKKMSKVDTLHCALDYIRSLSHVLNISYQDNSNGSITDQSLSEISVDEGGSLTAYETSDESVAHCSAEEYKDLSSIVSPDSFQTEQRRHLDSICNSSIALALAHAPQQLVDSDSTLKSVSSSHLLFKNKLSHSGATSGYNNGHVVEPENKQANGLILLLPSSLASSNFLNQNRIYTASSEPNMNIGIRDDSHGMGKENEEYIIGLPQHDSPVNVEAGSFLSQCRHSSIIEPPSPAAKDCSDNNGFDDRMRNQKLN